MATIELKALKALQALKGIRVAKDYRTTGTRCGSRTEN